MFLLEGDLPNQTAHLTALRAGNHVCNVYVSIMDGEPVLTGEVSADPETASALNVTYTLDTGDAADVYPGMRVEFRSALGDLKGTTSVRFAGSISSSSLPIREVSWGEIQLVTGDAFIVFNDFLPTDLLPSADESFSPDHKTYTDQTSNPGPVPTSGGHYPYLLPASGSIDIPFVGSTSYTVDPDSSGTVTHNWVCASGTWDDDTAEDPTLTLTSAGKYLVIHTATDDSNTKTEVQFIRVRIHDANDPPCECESVSVQGDDTTGFSASFRLYENATLADIPDGIMVCVWSQEFIDGEEQVYGNIVPSRSHILCTGYLQRDRGNGTDDRGDELEFDVISPLARYMALPGFSKALIRADAPTDWTQIKGMTIQRGIVHLFRNYTNIHQLFDVVFSDFDDADYPKLYLQKANVWEQIKELADSRGGRIVADMTGRIEIQERIELSSLLERTALPTISTIGGFDAFDYDVTREHLPALDTYRMRGFKAAAAEADTATYLVRFPSSPGRGPNSPTTEKAIFDDISHAFQQVALRGALENRVFFTSDGTQYHAPDGQFTLPGSYAHLFQFYRELFYLAVGFGSVLRDADISAAAFRWIPKAVSIDFAEGTLTASVTARAETHAPESGGVEDPITAGTITITEPGFTYPPPTLTPDLDANGLSAAIGTLAVYDSTNTKVHITNNLNLLLASGTPTFTDYALGLTGTLAGFVVRADSPKYIAGTGAVNGIVATTSQVRKISDIFGARTLGAAQSYTATSVAQVQLQSERGNPDNAIVMRYYDTGGTLAHYTNDAGGTWAASSGLTTNYDTNYLNNTPNWANGVFVDPRGNGVILTSCHTSTGSPPGSAFYRSTDGGANFSSYAPSGYTIDGYNARCIVRPLSRPDDVVFFGNHETVVHSQCRLYRVIGSTRTDVSPNISGTKYGVVFTAAQRAFSVADDDANAAVLVGVDSSQLGAQRGVFQTFNALATSPTWNVLVTPAALASVAWRGAYYVNRSLIYLFGEGGALAIWKYDGSTWRSYEMTIPGCGTIVGICGG